jgi:site-specific recombinase XerD
MKPTGDSINELIIAPSPDLRPAPLFAPTRKAARRFLEFFTAQINNAHTRRAYMNATRRFADWCASKDIHQLAQVQPFHVAAFVHDLQDELSPPSVKQHLAALRDYFVQGRRRWVRLHEKGGKEHDVPRHHRLDQCLHDYIETAGIADDVDGYLFRTARRKTGQLTSNPLFQQDAHRIIRRRAKAAGIETRIGNHTFRATGITAYLKNSGKLEVAQQIANHESPRTTKLYDRRHDEISLDEIERITIKKTPVTDRFDDHHHEQIFGSRC